LTGMDYAAMREERGNASMSDVLGLAGLTASRARASIKTARLTRS
jgi:hypothetical protein